MTVRPVVIFGDPVLHRPTRPVTAFDAELADLVEDLFETMAAANGVGLAANQIGVSRRVFVYDCPTHRGDPGPNHRGVIVNPVLTVAPRREWQPVDEPEDEGCLSVPGESFALLRSPWARVRGQDPTGRTQTVAGTDLFARCLQHETDHLDGLVYLDRLARRENREARRAVRANGWGGPGLQWMPGVDRDPFGHDDDDIEPVDGDRDEPFDGGEAIRSATDAGRVEATVDQNRAVERDPSAGGRVVVEAG